MECLFRVSIQFWRRFADCLPVAPFSEPPLNAQTTTQILWALMNVSTGLFLGIMREGTAIVSGAIIHGLRDVL